MPIRKRLIITGLVLPFLFLVGVEGYHRTEGWNYFESAYMTAVALSTAGFGEVHPLSRGARVLTMFLVFGGIGTLFYGLSAATAFLVEGDIRDFLRRRRMDNASDLKGHYILCGLGSLGRSVVDEIAAAKQRLVLIDSDPTRFRNLVWKGLFLVEGDATRQATLLSAGIKGARALITLLPNDKENLFVVLTAKELNPRLRVVSKGVEEESRRNLLKAGADSVIFPNSIGGFRIASEILRPTLTTFFDAILIGQARNLQLEEITIEPGCRLLGLTLSEAKIPERCGLIVFAVRDLQSAYRFNPDGSTLLREGDSLVVWGEERQVQRLRTLCARPITARRTA
jgi:voltage-gated potassium channel